jgi:DNA (cytosine-5)-methyltransferase 1
MAMGIDWMTFAELTQAIPPAYTEFIGQQLLQHLNLESPANE